MCRVRLTRCADCSISIGYHVVQACVFCTDLSDNNCQYWMFKRNTTALETAVLLYDLPLNHAPAGNPVVHGPDEDVDALSCTICGDLMFKPTRVACSLGHVFCRACIAREIDARHCCPLDRHPLDMCSAKPATDVQLELDKVATAAAALRPSHPCVGCCVDAVRHDPFVGAGRGAGRTCVGAAAALQS